MMRSEKAVSEVIGMITILSVMMIVIGAIMLAGVPMIESGKSRARMDVAANSFLSLQNDIEEVVRGPIWITDPWDVQNVNKLWPSRQTEFDLMGGTITVLSNNSKVSCNNNNCNNIIVNNNLNISIPASNITYQADHDLITYENGAVIRKYETGMPIMLSNPLINIYNTGSTGTIISIHVIRINGTLSSAGGDGKAFVETRLINYSQIEPAPSNTPNLDQINIWINTRNIDHSRVWGNFFDRKLNETGLVVRSGYNITLGPPLVIQITGRSNTVPDIFLSMYETSLDVRVR